MYERILLPTDGSVGSAHVAMQAIDLAEQYDAEVHVLYVVDEDLTSRIRGAKTTEQALEEVGENTVEKYARMVQGHDLAAVTAVRHGDPAQTILDYADEAAADLVVMGTHGRSGVERRLIGSVAERVVRHATCPVMTVRLPETDVTVEDRDHARDLAAETLTGAGYDAEVTGVDRQESVWVVEAEDEGVDLLVYIDPVTQRTSVVRGR
ncbi:MAG: universal stress protein [Halorientalis sp.]